jgi:hypothetical protein
LTLQYEDIYTDTKSAFYKEETIQYNHFNILSHTLPNQSSYLFEYEPDHYSHDESQCHQFLKYLEFAMQIKLRRIRQVVVSTETS